MRVFDDTTCRRVSSILGDSGPHRRGIRGFDDTMCRIVSSLLAILGPHGREIRVFDDTMRRRVSSFWVVLRLSGTYSGFLMILCVAEYHRFGSF